MDRIPILKMGDCLLVTIQVDMHDQLAVSLQEDLTDQIAKHAARGVLIDISSLEIVDSFIGRMLANIAAMSRVLDAQTVLTGMQPAVAITLVEGKVAVAPLSEGSERGTAYCLGEILVSQISSSVEGEGIPAERRAVHGKIHLNEVIVSVKLRNRSSGCKNGRVSPP